MLKIIPHAEYCRIDVGSAAHSFSASVVAYCPEKKKAYTIATRHDNMYFIPQTSCEFATLDELVSHFTHLEFFDLSK